MKFYTQYFRKPLEKEKNFSPSETIPDQSMTIQEIIARFVRTGTYPVAVHSDNGGNSAFEPGFDPLDTQPQEIQDMLNNPPKNEKEQPSSDSPKVEPKDEPKA